MPLKRSEHEVTAIFRGEPNSYSGIRSARANQLATIVIPGWTTEFGSHRFLSLLNTPWDLFCHHASEMENYRSFDFNLSAASAKNTKNIRTILNRLAANGCRRIVFTGTVFEPYEGQGDDEARAFSPYGLSKHISYEVFRLETHTAKMTLGKFVVPNPFGPYEEPTRFTSYAVREWSEGRTPQLRTPEYLRDNIHASALAKAYCRYCESLDGEAGLSKRCPSGYREQQGAFADRFAREIGARLNLCRNDDGIS